MDGKQMSVWSRVVGAVWIQSYVTDERYNKNINKLRKHIGKPVKFNSKNRITKLPRGSEGSLQYNIQKISKDEIILNVYGNLRDFSNIDTVYDWLNEHINNKYLNSINMEIVSTAISMRTTFGERVIFTFNDTTDKWEVSPVAG